ncbi:LacI family DNA-binding transcriptional regulator [Microbacterium sp. SLBN-146]|uniref:LacI family DNA-binding transcriptional regulator n=1 Tax=Microbacterium sp. SLBN-146 TaxID=2768457 RepID=UPI001150ED41|nr:LacI family DNA-binding transcriptional regulator [Microbacterium sp. SLBN-146]TQJ29844.1 LacI family transcriptional regulator [Microbacterium sp. SLBN-146]
MPPSPEPRTTLAHLAAATGLSVATVSRALGGRGELSPATRARVVDAARRLGYTRTGERRGRPRAGTAGLIDLVLGGFHDPYADEVTVGARSAAAAAGYDLVLTAERDDPDDDWPARIRGRGSAGAVLGLVVPTAAQLSLLRDASIPVVLLDPRADDTHGLPSVRTTDHAGGAAAAAHLIEAGATRFVVIVGTPAYRFGRARIEGFLSVVRERMPQAEVARIDTDWWGTGVRRACRASLASHGDRVGVFVCADSLAAGVYAAAKEAGRGIPDSVLVVGFDDLRGARTATPPLTTVHQPIREMAAEAVGMLVRAASGEHLAPDAVTLPTTLVVRGSTRAGHDSGIPSPS